MRTQARSHRAEKANLEELNFSRIDLKSRLRRVFVARASLSSPGGRRNPRTEGKRRIFTLRFSHLIRLKVARKRDGTFVTGRTIGPSRFVTRFSFSFFLSFFLSFSSFLFSSLFRGSRSPLPAFIASHNCGIVPLPLLEKIARDSASCSKYHTRPFLSIERFTVNENTAWKRINFVHDRDILTIVLGKCCFLDADHDDRDRYE